MTRENLQNIFRRPYSFDVWQSLLINLFGASEIRKTPSDIACDNDNVVKGEFLGELNTSDRYAIGLFAFEVNDNTKIAINRIGLRRLVHNYTSHIYDAAIAIFYNDKQWRLSFICDLKDEGTAPKRYTYVFGNEAESYRTAALQLFKLYDTKPTFQSIKDAFSVEKLSKDFFTEYKKQYDKFVKHINETKQNSDPKHNRDYVKKMMGRLVFLQFLQKKGWMNGDPNYLQNLYAGSEYKDDFLEQVLEPLFFEVLNTKECYRDSQKLAALGGEVNIPYLNGGLFERDSNDNRVVVFEAKQFEELFEFFSHYNFTIDENDPYDSEVGIDPEMLGHIFENLLEDNKDKGAFYTPKEIVQYMCRQSLIEYLQSKLGKNDDIVNLVNNHQMGDVLNKSNYLAQNAAEIARLLDEVKICDPAIGSGAFPMGILNEIFHLKLTLNPTLNECRAEVKRGIIQNSIYGVDIEQGAVDIARLRFWLSLVVDEDIAQPLPNLDYKIMCGNSLLSRHALDTPINEVFAEYNKGKKEEDKFTLEKYKALVSEYTNNSNKEEKAAFRTKIEDIKQAFKTELDKGIMNRRIKLQREINDLKAETLFGAASREELKLAKEKEKKLKVMLQNESDITSNKLYADAFEWRFEFPALLDDNGEFEGFDIVIGNPPYGYIFSRSFAEYLLQNYKSAEYKVEAYSIFVEAGLRLASSGIVCMITPYTFLSGVYFSKYRTYINSKNIQLLTILGKKVFEAAEVDTGIIVLSNKSHESKIPILDARGVKDRGLLQKLQPADLNRDLVMFNYEEGIVVANEAELNLYKKIVSLNNDRLANHIQFYHGVQTRGNSKAITLEPNENSLQLVQGKDFYNYTFTPEIRYITFTPSNVKSGGNLSFHQKDKKIVIRTTADRIVSTLDTTKSIVLNSVNIATPITDSPIECYLALFNSKLVDFWYRLSIQEFEKTFAEVKIVYLQRIPVSIRFRECESSLQDIVTQVLYQKSKNPQADTSALEAEIDQMVYTLYNLTPEEITLIENK